MKIIFNGNIIDEKLWKISPVSPAFNYGDGFFTTIKVIDKIPQLMELHLNRIKSSLDFFSYNIDLPNFFNLISKLLTVNNMENARVKIIFYKDIKRISYLIYCFDLNIDTDPLELNLSKYIRGNDPILRYKSINYFNNLHSPFKVFLDWNNKILETGFANIFIIMEDVILTPSLELPILPGIFRQSLIDKGHIGGYLIKEKIIDVSELNNCKSIFLTNSIRGIIPVKSFENKILTIPEFLKIKK